MHQKMMNSHMTFTWGKNSKESLISYLIDLISVFLLSLLVECLSHTRFINAVTNDIVAGLMQTVLYGVRIGLAYLVMLLVMSCNVGILLAAVAGFSAGFLLFGSRVFRTSETIGVYQKPTDLPPLNC
ncbi:copper transporter 1-like [Rhododendron vialii]|uniref:copper transporter 1-like n=1 Tax=Rhododendron vialii TaxID=182163 RepID=UPI0026604224|nr:copper transporter 1-like [Rhododendron vialii]